MSGEKNEGKWYVPRDLGIIKATEELDGEYYCYKGEDGKDRWMPAEMFKERFLPVVNAAIPNDFVNENVEGFVKEFFPKKVIEEQTEEYMALYNRMLSHCVNYVSRSFLIALTRSNEMEGDGR